jgi:DNA-directed RNA polymerase subunit RPC12/RpoP
MFGSQVYSSLCLVLQPEKASTQPMPRREDCEMWMCATCGAGTRENCHCVKAAPAIKPAILHPGRIEDECPSCGHRTLFIGNGGWLTCSWIPCKAPGVGAVMQELKANQVEAQCDCRIGDFVGNQGDALSYRCLRCGKRPPTNDVIHVRLLRKPAE